MSVYLSRLILNPRNREVRRDLGNCHGLHQRILAAFPDQPGIDGHARSHFGVLYRVETHPRTGLVQLLVQSTHEPAWSNLADDYLTDAGGEAANPACRTVDEAWASIQPGMHLTFRLRANPTKRIDKRHKGTDKLAGKRVELQTEPEWLDWLARHATNGGFELLTVSASADAGAQIANRQRAAEMFGFDILPGEPIVDTRASPSTKVTGHKDRGDRRLTFGAVLFEGRLRVTDADAFRDTLARGIGSGKAYGFGLLSIAPAR